ncbi:MAG TPA: phage tail sheath subtilisin-like domain-containing protein [Bacillota bacterium]|nr:phage tail sheath subtilisin-like domain-containing protein [Bacillota bacterium]
MKNCRINYMALVIAVSFAFGQVPVNAADIADTPEEPAAIQGVEASVAGFLGEAERGPTEPRLLKSWEEYYALYGGSKNSSSYLPHTVKGFFENGGKKLYVGRIVDKAATAAKITLLAGKAPVLTLRAIGEGSWGNRLQVLVSAASEGSKDDPMFKLEIYYSGNKLSAAAVNPILNKLKVNLPLKEVFDNLSMDKESENYYAYKIKQNSNLITVNKEEGGSGIVPDLLKAPSNFTGGSDGGNLDLEDYLGDKGSGLDAARGLVALDAIDEISLLYCPDTLSIDGLNDVLIQHCENLSDRMVILDSQKDVTNPMLDENYNSSYAALYYPWITINADLTGTQLLVPPGGHIAGIYALVEAQYGVNRAPAGMVIKGAKGLEFSMTPQQVDTLNLRGINAIREIALKGITVWGTRTLAARTDSEYKYVSIRRLENYIEESISEGLDWTRNWLNDQELWARVNTCIADFLTREWRKGYLAGTRERDAFFVKVDRTTMSRTDIEEGRLIVDIGVALIRPGEFYIIRIMLPVQGSN